MKSSPKTHQERTWRVHAIARDFDVIDVWQFELGAHDDFDRFVAAFWAELKVAEGWALSRMRLAIGRVMGWDRAPHSRPIPGCTETSVGERMRGAAWRDNRVRAGDPSPLPSTGVRPLYRFTDEALYELSNDTVHALLHLGHLERGASLAVYVKSRGMWTALYMAAIWPFRHLYLYPRLVRRIERRTSARATTPDLGAAVP